MSRAVYVCVVPVRCFIFYVCCCDCDSSFLFFRCLVDLVECYLLAQSVSLLKSCCDCCCKSRLTVVYVTDSSDIDMRFCSFKLLFCQFESLLNKFNKMELLSRLELPNLLITNEVLYRLSYSSTPILFIVLYFTFRVNIITATDNSQFFSWLSALHYLLISGFCQAFLLSDHNRFP